MKELKEKLEEALSFFPHKELSLKREELEHLRSLMRDGWVSVEERLPKEEDSDETGKVLVFRETTPEQKGMRKALFDWNMLKYSEGGTYWMPLPKNPTP